MSAVATVEESVPAVRPEQETSPAESPGTCRGISHWESYPLATTDDGDLLAVRARQVARTYGLPLETATLMCLSTVAAAAGSAYELRSPGGLTAPAAVHALFATPSPTPARVALEDAFFALRARVRGALISRSRMTATEVAGEEKRILGKMLEAKKIEAEAEKAETGSGTEAFFARYRDPPEERRQRAEAIRVKAVADNVRLSSVLRPTIIVEGVTPANLMGDMAELSHDGCVFDLDPDARFWTALASEKPTRAREVADRIAAGWNGSPRLMGGVPKPGTLLSSASVLDYAGFAKIWNSRAVRDGGLRKTIFVCGTEGTKVEDDGQQNGGATGKFNQLLLGLTTARHFGETKPVKMTGAANDAFLKFVGDVGQEESAPDSPGSDVLAGAAHHALRNALLLHLGAGKAENEMVGEDTMRRAIALVTWGIRCAARALDGIAGSGNGGGDGDWDEVVQMALKVQRKGRVTKRQLFRSFNDQRSSVLMPVLDRAVEAGLVVRRDDGKLEVPVGLGGE